MELFRAKVVDFYVAALRRSMARARLHDDVAGCQRSGTSLAVDACACINT